MQRICLSLSLTHTHTHITYSPKKPLFTCYPIIHSAGKDKWLAKPRQTQKSGVGLLLPTNPPSSGILPLLSLQPASSSAPAFIFPVKRAGGRERRTLNNQHSSCSSVFSPSLLSSSRFLHSLRGGSGSISDTLPRAPLQEAERQSHR